MVISPDNPFRDKILRHLAREQGESTQEMTMHGGNMMVEEEITFTRKRKYTKGVHWIKLTQNREAFANLSPIACKMLVYIALNLEPEAEKIHIPPHDVALNRRTLSKALVELILAGVIRKEKKTWYWVDVTLLIIGTIRPDQTTVS